MPTFTLQTCIRAATLLLVTVTSAFPLQNPSFEWSFTLHPSTNCTASGDPYTGSGSTRCRANLNGMAPAYTLNNIDDGCRIEFFDNTMCDANEISDIAGQVTSTHACRVLSPGRRVGSYQVTCE